MITLLKNAGRKGGAAMPLCAYRDVRMKTDDTVVENAFIREYLPTAPEDCVRVYLYGLMQCQSGTGPASLASFARTLHMEESEVEHAFSYWQKLGLLEIRKEGGFSVLYLSARNAMPVDETLYTQSSYNEHLQSIFSPRSLTAADLSTIYEWTDVFKIEQPAVILLIQYGRSKLADLEKATVSRQLRYIGKIALQWADEGIHTPEQANVWLMQQDQHAAGLTALLKRLGLHRAPTVAERKLYQSWLQQGFTPKAILLAADRTTTSRNPSLDTVGNVLLSLSSLGATSEDAIAHEQSERLCREALTALGLRQPTPNATQLHTYRAWVQQGYQHEHILLACELCNAQNHRTMRDVQDCLARWRAAGLTAGRAIRAYEANRQQDLAALSEMFRCMGLSKKPQEADLALYQTWTQQWGLSHEVLLFASECSHGAVSPYRMCKRLIEQWHQSGVQNVAAARKAFSQQRSVPSPAKAPALQYAQRPVDRDEEHIDWF